MRRVPLILFVVVVASHALAWQVGSDEDTDWSLGEETAVASVREATLAGDFLGSAYRVQVKASGTFPHQRIEQLQLWIGGVAVKVPREAYEKAWNPNPANIELRERTGTNPQLLPDDVREPIGGLVVWGYSQKLSVVVLLEERVAVLAVTMVNGITPECHVFDQRFEAVCGAIRNEGERVEEVQTDGRP